MRKFILICFAVLLLNISAFASYKDAVELFQKKEYKESLKKVAEVLEVVKDMEPGSPNYKLRFLAAHNHWKLGNIKPAVIHFMRCMDIAKNRVEPYIDLALFRIDQKQYDEAIRLARKGMSIKKDAMFYYVLGKVSLLRKSYWKAKTFFEKANAINQEIYISYHDLGVALMKLKRYSHANTAFSAALALNADSPEILNNLALSYEMLDQFRDAKRYYREALSYDKNNVAIRKNLEKIKDKK